MTHVISSTSKEYVKVPIARDDAANLTGLVVQMAFTANGVDPEVGDWKAADWQTIDGVYEVRCLVGPGGGTITLADGIYDVYVQINAAPELVVIKAPNKLKVV